MTVQRIDLGGITLNVRDEGHGEAVLLLHGFPDSCQLWRHQIPALVEAGYRAIAPDLRGFGASDKPPALAAYRLETILEDVLALLDQRAVERAHLVGHDWGAVVAWLLAGVAPARTASLTALSVGHLASFRAAGWAQRLRSWYVLAFQFTGLAEAVVRANDWALFRRFVRHHDELERWLADLARPGALTAGLNWYRANMRPGQAAAHEFPRVAAPALGVWSSRDVYLTERQMTGSAAFVDASWRYVRLEGASHWMQLDRPAEVNSLLLEFLHEVS